jgi:hypothetical protein
MPGMRHVLTVTAASIGLVACGGDGGGDDGGGDAAQSSSGTSAEQTEASAPASGDALLIETRITDARRHTGEVVDGSVLGEAVFCPGGTTSGGSDGAAITATFTCPSGSLVVRYAPRQPSLVQSSAWEVVRGTGDLEGLRGGGSMVAAFDSDDPDAGREVFTGTVSR